MQLHRIMSISLLALILSACGGGGCLDSGCNASSNSGSSGSSGGSTDSDNDGDTGGGDETSTPGNASLLMYAKGADTLIYSGNGEKAVFKGISDPVNKNPDEAEQIFSIDLSTNIVTQVTNNSDSEIRYTLYDMSDDGTTIVFASEEDLTGDNADNTKTVFTASTVDGSFKQVFHDITTSYISSVQISGDASTITFLSERDLTGDNPDLDIQIFVMDANGENMSQVTTLDTWIFEYTLADSASKIAFTTHGDLLGVNADESLELFLISIDGTELEQITTIEETSLALYEQTLRELSISDDAKKVAFESNMDFVEGNNINDINEVYVVEIDTQEVVQLTNVGSSYSEDSTQTYRLRNLQLSGNGSYAVFTHEYDFTGEKGTNKPSPYWANSNGEGAVVQALRSETLDVTYPAGESVIESFISNDGSNIVFRGGIGFAINGNGSVNYDNASSSVGIYQVDRK